ncbi:MAG: hypothetical protein IT220_00220 [Flavobacteriaceae bacterium]|nr:hypothetical protein [Flavobacteriaceae bacterium]
MLDKLKSIFVVTDETTKKEETIDPKSEKASEKVASEHTSQVEVPSRGNVQGVVSQPILDKLLGVINQSNQSGFDYIEFKNSLKALEKMGLDEKTMYRSAFATAQTIGVSVPNLVSSIDFYKKILNKENSEFSNALNVQVNAKVADKEKEIEGYKSMIAEKEKQLALLTQEIEKHKQSIQSLSSKIETDRLQIDKTKSDFVVTFDFIMQQLDGDAKKIKEFLE